MLDAWIIICVLTGITLVTNIAVCLYTLHLSKQAERRQHIEGYAQALIDRELDTEEYKKEGTE